MTRETIAGGRCEGMNYGTGISHGKAGFVIFLLLFIAFAVFANGAEASRGYLTSFSATYPNSPLTKDCLICHTTTTASSSTRNPYGSAYGNNNHDFAAIESLDSDGDNFSNIAEINGGTYPGNASSVPAGSVAGPMTVSSGNLTSSGTPGGPFIPSSQSFTVTNTGTASMAWTASKTQSWVTLSSAGGTLAAGATATVTATIGSGANSLAAGSYGDTVTFTNTSNGTGNATRSIGLTINAGSVSLSSIAITGLTSVNEGATATYTATATWSDGSTTTVTPAWSVTSGPAMISGAGVLTASAVTATAPAVINASFTAGTVTRTTSITVNIVDVAEALTISTVSPLPEGTLGTLYNLSFAATGGTTPRNWSVSAGALPAGLNLSAEGFLSGTPTAAATSGFTVQVTGGGTATKPFSLTINDVTPPAGALDVMPRDTATDVPVNTVITAMESGLTDISAIFNGDTFMLRPDVSTPDSTMDPSWPYRSAVCTSGGVVQGTFTYNAARTEATFTPNCPLENGTTYLASVAAGSGSTLTAPDTWSFITIASSPDSDGDGSPDNEDDSPNDDRQTSRWDSKGHGKFHIDSSRTAGTHLREAVAISDSSSSLNQSGKPDGYAFQDGMVAFQEVGVAPGSSAEVTVTFPSHIPKGSKVYQAGADGFHEVSSAYISGNTVTLTVTGGNPSIQAEASLSDNVAQENGIFVDPIGVAAPVSSGSGSIDLTSSSSGGGCSVVGGAGSGGSNIDAFLILAGLGLISWRSRMRHRRK